MSQIVSVDVPPLNMMFMGLQCQERRQLCGRLLELRRENTHTHHPLGQHGHWPHQEEECTTLSVTLRPYVCTTQRLFAINQKHASSTPHVFPRKYTVLSNSPGGEKIFRQITAKLRRPLAALLNIWPVSNRTTTAPKHSAHKSKSYKLV